MNTKEYFETRKEEEATRHLKVKAIQFADLQRVGKAIDEISDIGNGKWKIGWVIRDNDVSLNNVRLYLTFTEIKFIWLGRLREHNIYSAENFFYLTNLGGERYEKTDEGIAKMLYDLCKLNGFYP